jgi:hypothetical protein
VPDFMIGDTNNRDLPESEQVTVEVHPLSFGEQQRYNEMMRLKGKPNRGGFKTNSAEVNRKIFCDNVRKPKNITFEGTPVVDPGLLYDEGTIEMVNDIIEAIQDQSKLGEADQKNSNA